MSAPAMTGPPWRLAVARAAIGGTFARERGRLALATLAIALGIALGFAIELINGTAVAEFTSGMAALSGRADLEVRGPRTGFDEQLYAALARVDGVAVASPIVEVEARLPERGETLRIFGVDPFRAAQVTPVLVGIADHALDVLDPNALFVSPTAARELALQPGDRIALQVGLAVITLHVAGSTPAGVNERYAVMDIAAAQDRLQRGGRLTRIDLRLSPGADPASVQAVIRRALPAGVVVAEPAAAVDATTRLSRAYRINLNVLALVALFTGSLLVFSMQALAVTRRRAQLALLRTLGLTRRRVVALIVGEAALIGVVGAVIGLPGGFALAQFAVERFGGDLGAGYFRGAPPQLTVDATAAVLYGALGILAAMAGAFVPAQAAARADPAAALKPGDAEYALLPLRAPWPGLALLALGALATQVPPVGGLPLFGYGAIALLLFGTLLLLPRIATALLAAAPRSPYAPASLAIDQLRGASGQASVSLAAIVASVALFVSMAIMVASFRQSLDDWLTRVLPADVYVRPGLFADSAFFSTVDQQRIAALDGVARVEFSRADGVLIDAARPRVTLIARTLDDPLQRLPLEGNVYLPAASDPPAVWVTEAMRDLYGFSPGQRVTLPLAGRNVAFTVAGVWRDYARQQGALLIDRAQYIASTGDRNANEAALWLRPGITADTVRREIESSVADADRVTVATAGELRQISLRVFDRTFAVTYALEAAAVAIGLAGLASSFGALALARRREFGMLRHLGMTRGQIGAMLATEGAVVSGIGLSVGLALGGVISLILIHVVNRQSFHWTMDLAVPWSALVVFSCALLALALLTTLVAAREALDEDAVRVVKDDW
jgi:putative ABC transport system permease protein